MMTLALQRQHSKLYKICCKLQIKLFHEKGIIVSKPTIMGD